MNLCYICRTDLYEHTELELASCLKLLNQQINSSGHWLENSTKNSTKEIARSKAINFLSTSSINLHQRLADFEKILNQNGVNVDDMKKLLRKVK